MLTSRRAYLLIATVLLAVLVAAEPALAASGIGDRVGDEVQSWAVALLLAVAALVGIPALAKRDMSGALVIALIALVLGGFVFAPGTIQNVIEQIWQTFEV